MNQVYQLAGSLHCIFCIIFHTMFLEDFHEWILGGKVCKNINYTPTDVSRLSLKLIYYNSFTTN